MGITYGYGRRQTVDGEVFVGRDERAACRTSGTGYDGSRYVDFASGTFVTPGLERLSLQLPYRKKRIGFGNFGIKISQFGNAYQVQVGVGITVFVDESLISLSLSRFVGQRAVRQSYRGKKNIELEGIVHAVSSGVARFGINRIPGIPRRSLVVSVFT